jgi:hypothetical protein
MKDVVDSGISSAPGTKREVKQALWIDVETLLPLRWEMVVDGIATPYGLSFAHDPSLQIAPPKDVRAPSCVRDQ